MGETQLRQQRPPTHHQLGGRMGDTHVRDRGPQCLPLQSNPSLVDLWPDGRRSTTGKGKEDESQRARSGGSLSPRTLPSGQVSANACRSGRATSRGFKHPTVPSTKPAKKESCEATRAPRKPDRRQRRDVLVSAASPRSREASGPSEHGLQVPAGALFPAWHPGLHGARHAELPEKLRPA